MRGVFLLALMAALASGCPKPVSPTLPLVVSDDPAATQELRTAERFEQEGDVESAEQRYEVFLATYPSDPLAAVAALNLGRLLLARGSLPEARAEFERVMENSDESIAERGRFFQAVTQHLQGEHQPAVDTLSRLRGRTIDPEDTSLLYRTLAAAQMRLGLRTAAVASYDRMLSEATPEPDKVEVRQQLDVLVREAAPEELRAMRIELPRNGHAWPLVAKRELHDAFTRGDLATVRTLGQELNAAGVELSSELRAMTLRAERTVRVDPRAIGAVLPLSGRGREVGQLALQAMMLAASLPPDQPAGPNTPRIFFRDSGGDASRADTAVGDLVTLHQVAAIVGPPSGDASRAAARRAQELGVPFISLAPDETITETGERIFRYFPTATEEANALVAAATARGARRFAILRPGHAFGRRSAETFARAVRAQGGEIVANIEYEETATSFRDPATALRAHSFDALYIPDAAARIALVAPALAAVGLWSSVDRTPPPRTRDAVAIRILLPSVGYDASALRNSERYLQGALVSRPFDPNFDDASRAFAAAFTEQYGRPPDVFAAAAFDAVRVLLTAAAANAEGNTTSREGIAQSLRGVSVRGAVSASAGLSATRTPLAPVRVGEIRGDVVTYAPPAQPSRAAQPARPAQPARSPSR